MKRMNLAILAAAILVLALGGCGEQPTSVAPGPGPRLSTPPGDDVILRGDVGDFVWFDQNDNGMQDDGAMSGVNGVAVIIECIRSLDGSPWTMTLTTANSPQTGLPGWYNFNSVPAGSCMAYLDPATVPPDLMISSKPCGGPLEFIIGEGPTGNNNKNIDFCLVQRPLMPGAIGDFVWCDLNDDGIQDPGEPGVPGVVVNLMCSGGHTDQTMTDANGYYLFTGVPAGMMCTVSVDPTSFPPDKEQGTHCPIVLTLTLAEGQTNLDQDFCLIETPPVIDCCENGRPDEITFRYVAEDCSHTQNSQDPGKVTCDDYGMLTADVYIFVTDKDLLGHHKEKVFFEGPVSVGGTFTMSAVYAGADRIPGDTRIWVLNQAGTTVLQKVKLHTSCSQPLIAGEQFGSLVLVSCGQ